MKHKILILNIIVAIVAVLSIIAILAGGSTYHIQTGQYAPEGEIVDMQIRYDNDGIVEKIDAFQTDKGEMIIAVRALKQGLTKMHVEYKMNYSGSNRSSWIYDTELEVWWFDLILDRQLDSFSGYDIAIYAIVFILLVIEIVMLWVFFGCLWKGDFSYSMVTGGSIAIFIGVLLLFAVYKLLNNVVRTFGDFVRIVSDIGYLALILLIPVMLVMSVFLTISNFWLMRHEGRRPVNGLGIAFGLLWLIGTLVALGPTIMFYDFGLPDVVTRSVIYVLCYFECLFLSTVVCSFLSVRYRPAMNRDYIIILGCGIRKDGTLTPILRGRVDAAIAFEKKQFKRKNKHAIFVPSGGQGPDEVIPESEAMTRYLRENGIPEEQILQEDRSTSTYENMKFSKSVIESHGGDIREKKIAFATTNYHIFRGYILSAKCGFTAKGIASRTKTYFYPNAFLREFIGLLVDKWMVHAANVIVLVLFFLVLDWLT